MRTKQLLLNQIANASSIENTRQGDNTTSDYENDEQLTASAYALSENSSPDFYVHQQRDPSPHYNQFVVNYNDHTPSPINATNNNQQFSQHHYYKEQEYQLSPIQESQSSSVTILNKNSINKQKLKFQQDKVQKTAITETTQSTQPIQQVSQRSNQLSIDSLKQSVEYLFVYYCEFNLDKGTIFLKQSNFIKLLKDACILHQQSTLKEKEINLIISQEMGNPLLKSLDFQSFLNILVKIAVIKFELDEHFSNPKLALQRLLDEHILPLLTNIEESIQAQNNKEKNQIAQITSSGQYITKISIDTLQSIAVSDEEIFILKSVNHVLQELYVYYFASKKPEHSLKTLLKFLKDFDICPYLLNQKTCFMIYYFSVVFKSQQPQHFLTDRVKAMKIPQQILNTSRLGNRSKLSKDNQQTPLKTENPHFTYEHFMQIFLRIAIVIYDLNSPDKTLPNAKKLLNTLTRIELTQGFNDFISYQRQLKSINCQFTLTPPKQVLMQLILNQQQFQNQQELEYYRDDYLPEMDTFTLCKLYLEQENITDLAQFTQKQQKMLELEQNQNDMESFLEQEQEKLQRIFQYYCSYGDPMNTNKLKSNKLIKLFNDAQLLISNKTTIEKILNQSQLRTPQAQTANQDQLMIDRNELDLIFKKIAAKATSESGFANKSQMSRTPNASFIMKAGSGKSPLRDSFLKTIKQDKAYAKIVEVNIDQGSINFEQFKEVLFEASKALARGRFDNEHRFFIHFVKEMILPVLANQSDEKYVFNDKISKMLGQLENENVLILLSDLYQVITPIFELYADHRGYVDFKQFVKFCTDYSLFPDILNKSELHKIFINLAIEHQHHEPSKLQESMISRSKNTSVMSISNKRYSHAQQQQQEQTIFVLDSHLFIQALAFCALHIDASNQTMILDQDQEALEKLFLFIEKISMAEGLKRDKTANQKIKTLKQEKIDIAGYFRKKYKWYFDVKNQQIDLEKTLRIKHTAFKALVIMDQKNANQLSARKPDIGDLSYRRQSTSKNNLKSKQSPKTDLFTLVLQDDN